MADTDAHPPKIRPEQRVDRAQSVMAGSTATALHPQLARSQVNLIVDHSDVCRWDPKEPRCLGNRLARVIHIGLRLQQKPSFAGDHPLREFALEAAAKAPSAMTAGDQIDRQKADIVPVPGIASARIAKADDETHHTVRSEASPNPGQRTYVGAAAGCSAAGGALAAAAASSRTADDAATLAI